ncbi:MAG: helix-turn-helix transcriptional regulator [Janthinobacterium lividum]
MSLPLNLLTAEDLAPLVELVRQILVQQTAAAQPADDYLSVAQVAQATGTSERTVRKWIEQGKRDKLGQKLIKLFTLEFSPGYVRVPRSALLAFGQGVGFEAAHLQLPPAGAAPVAPAKAKRPGPVLDSSEALRRAS